MYNKDKEINQLNALNAKSATKYLRNSLILEDLEADSVADFLRQLSLDDQGRQRSEEEEINRRNADVLDAIGKAIAVTQYRAEEKRRKAEEERYQAQRKLELERQKVVPLLLSACLIWCSKNGNGRKENGYDWSGCELWRMLGRRPKKRLQPQRKRRN